MKQLQLGLVIASGIFSMNLLACGDKESQETGESQEDVVDTSEESTEDTSVEEQPEDTASESQDTGAE